MRSFADPSDAKGGRRCAAFWEESLEITSVRTAVLNGNFPWVLVRIETDEGITGLGEAYWGAGVAELVHKAAPLIVGENPLNVGKICRGPDPLHVGRGLDRRRDRNGHQRYRDCPLGPRGPGAEHADFHPVWRPLPGADPGLCRLPCRRNARPRRLRIKGESRGRGRFTALKFDLDTPNPHTTDISDDPHPSRRWFEPFNRTIGNAERRWMVDVVAACREAVGPDTMLGMDAHWKFSVNDAIKLAQDLEPFDLMWLEDPIPPENIEAQRHVTHSTRTPICTGENVYRKHGFRELIEKQAARIIAPDIPKMGGLMEAKKVADHADMYYIPVAPHNVASPIGTVASGTA